ncbi:hypothetical protein EZV62_022878 [Acer yangbiense]|uniref:Uncharacterized protein n=1 Tax=Acer yangbiense TaxID=1000413 RepID=A0A5C7GZZ9_9ROSI|nr:hypothetical protein EZV62_022878 [Acer yangbiense]
MPDSEKLMALKKAYADIILNTAKEAAARIMVSERKAIRYQRELFAAKEEALHMLLRLKQTLDAKDNEAQVTSFCQQQKIDELEAQLGEAEDIVRDLRAELREAQEELEIATKSQMQLMNEHNSIDDIAAPVTTSQENIHNTSEIMVSSLPDEQSEMVSTSDVDLTLNGTNDSNKCHSENGSHKDNCYFCNSDFASIVMRRKEPKLYRNGCTQRIRACGRNLIDGNFSLPGQIDDVKNGTSIGEGEEDEEGVCKNLDPQPDEMCGVENNPSEVKMMQADSNCISVDNSFRRKRNRRGRRIPVKVIKTAEESDLSCPGTFSTAVNDNVQEDSKFSENKAEKDPKMVLQSGCEEVTGSDLEFVKACTVQTTTNNDELLIDTLELTRQESGCAQSSEVPACKTDLETENVSLVNSDAKSSTFVGVLPTQSLNDKFIKYTFQRKRKKELMSSTDGDSWVDESIVKRKMEGKQNDILKSQNSSLVTESSRDSRRLVQVARQLISLSEKKQWK